MITQLIKKALHYLKPYEFKHSSSIQKQRMVFEFRNREFIIEADGSTPLYETICELVDYDCYQLSQIDFSAFNKDSIALDIGGNVGAFSMMLSAIFPGKILCFEPVPENCVQITRNLELNGITNVEIWPNALCSQDIKIRFFKPRDSVGGSIFVSGNTTSVIEVEAMSIASLMMKYPSFDLIKMDCEGSEFEIIPDLLNLKVPVKYFTAEIHDRRKSQNVGTISKLLVENGYRIFTKPERWERRGLSCLFAEKS